MGQENIQGKIVDNNQTPLINASIHWINTDIGTISDENGYFKKKTQCFLISWYSSPPAKVLKIQNNIFTIKVITYHYILSNKKVNFHLFCFETLRKNW